MARSPGNGTVDGENIEHSEKRESAETATPSAAAGRIVHDERGNAVWNWAKNGSGTSIGSTSQMLKALQLPELRVEGETPPVKEPETKTKRRGSGYGPGYNPYDRTAPVRKPPAPKKVPDR